MSVGCRELDCAPAQCLVELAQVNFGFERRPMSFLHGSYRFGKEIARPPEHPIFGTGQVQGGEGLVMNPREVQRMKSGRQCPAPEPAAGPQLFPRTSLYIISQSLLVAPRKHG